MSTNYDVYCRTCRDELGLEYASIRVSAMCVLHAAPELAALAEAVHEDECPVTVSYNFGYKFNLYWFAIHKGHDMCVRDEYGRFHDECGAMSTCQSCDDRFNCRLKPGHAGEHRRKP